jgi:hypothetical protein
MVPNNLPDYEVQQSSQYASRLEGFGIRPDGIESFLVDEHDGWFDEETRPASTSD